MKRLGAAVAAAILLAAAPAVADGADPLSAQANTAFLAKFAHEKGVTVTKSGLAYRVIRSGNGESPAADDAVTVYYRGQLIDGSVFDATKPGHPASFPVGGVIPGWTEALERMRVGDEWELAIPSRLAYGSDGAAGVIPPDQTLVFVVQLVAVHHGGQ